MILACNESADGNFLKKIFNKVVRKTYEAQITKYLEGKISRGSSKTKSC